MYKPIKKKITPYRPATAELYLSAIAPKIGDPTPIIRNWIAIAKPKTSLPVWIYSEIGIKYNPDECLIPNEISKRTHPPNMTSKDEECLNMFINIL